MPSYVVPHTYGDVPALVDRVIAGDHVVITREGRVVAELVPVRGEVGQPAGRRPVDHDALQELVEARDRLPPLGMSSVEFLQGMQDEARD